PQLLLRHVSRQRAHRGTLAPPRSATPTEARLTGPEGVVGFHLFRLTDLEVVAGPAPAEHANEAAEDVPAPSPADALAPLRIAPLIGHEPVVEPLHHADHLILEHADDGRLVGRPAHAAGLHLDVDR